MNIGTKIKYLKVENKIYKVAEISFCDMTITAVEINTFAADLPKEEIFGYELFSDFKIKLINKNM